MYIYINNNMAKHDKKYDALEKWSKRHHCKLELLRTCTGILSASTSIIVLLKLFNAI